MMESNHKPPYRSPPPPPPMRRGDGRYEHLHTPVMRKPEVIVNITFEGGKSMIDHLKTIAILVLGLLTFAICFILSVAYPAEMTVGVMVIGGCWALYLLYNVILMGVRGYRV